MTGARAAAIPPIRLGLRANLGQFLLLLLINGFVGAMVGMERTVLPLVAEREFGLASRAAILSFLVTFGLVKALANLASGAAADRFGRRNTLIAGWLAGLPVAPMIILAPSWGWVVAANLLLGINQGLCWSAAIVMKVDLVGPRGRGLAIGLNEASGYLAVSLAALASGYLAGAYGLRPAPFLIGVAASALGLLCSLMVRETHGHARHEAMQRPAATTSFSAVFRRTSFGDRSLFAASQAGMVNNLNDGMSWGLLPLFFTARGATLAETAMLTALYPAVWALAQVATGPLSDRVGRKPMIAAGMTVQAASLAALGLGGGIASWGACMTGLGLGTAMVYPVLLGAISDHAHPGFRASAIGVYRLWRDLGYAIGALLAGATADLLGIPFAIQLVAALTLASGVVVALAYQEVRAGGGEPA